MKKLKPENKKIYLLNGVQLFSKVQLADLMGVNRSTVTKNIKTWGVSAAAVNNRNQDIYSVKSYFAGGNASRVNKKCDENFGGYSDAQEYKTVIETDILKIKLHGLQGDYVAAWEAESEIATCFADNARMGEELLTIIETELQPTGVAMERIASKFRGCQSKYYQQVLAASEQET